LKKLLKIKRNKPENFI